MVEVCVRGIAPNARVSDNGRDFCRSSEPAVALEDVECFGGLFHQVLARFERFASYRRVSSQLQGFRALTLAVLGFGCGEAGVSTEAAVGVDSSGVRIIEASPVGAPSWLVAESPEVQIGVVEGEEPYRFDQIRAAFLFKDGRIWVLNPSTSANILWSAG